MATYGVEFTEAAEAQLRKLDRAVARRILARLEALAENPYPAQSTPLVGRPGRRIRVGDYRIIYEVDGNRLLITVLDVGHRSTVYDR